MSVRRAASGDVIALLFTLAVVRSGYACQCGVRLPPAESLDKSVAVFAGTVNDLRTVRFESVAGDRASVVVKEVRFTANRIWRGDGGSSVILLMGNSDCDYPFELGYTYLVYADGVDSATGYLTASICGPTKRLELASEDLRLLRSSRRLAKPLFRPESTNTRLPLIALIGAAIGGAVAATLLLHWLRWSRHRHRSNDG
jgi:hypothetical protein